MTWRIITQLVRLFRPPRIVAVTRRPAGWFAVGRRALHDVLAWGVLADGEVVALVASRGGLRPAVGRGWHGFLPAAPHAASDVQITPPPVSVPPADLVEAIGDGNPWENLEAIQARLRLAVAESDWSRQAALAMITDPKRFIALHLRAVAEHGHAAVLDSNGRLHSTPSTTPRRSVPPMSTIKFTPKEASNDRTCFTAS